MNFWVGWEDGTSVRLKVWFGGRLRTCEQFESKVSEREDIMEMFPRFWRSVKDHFVPRDYVDYKTKIRCI